MVDINARLEEIEANSQLRQEAAAEEAGRLKKEAEAEKASEKERQQHSAADAATKNEFAAKERKDHKK